MWEMYSERILFPTGSFTESPVLFQKIGKVRQATIQADVYLASRILGTFGRLKYKIIIG